MSRKRQVVVGLLVLLVVVVAFVYNQVQIGLTGLQLDLQWIGESIYQARSQQGKWPTQLDDLNGTTIDRVVPRVKNMVQNEHYVIVWQRGLDPSPEANADRILAYDNHSRLRLLGKVWVCWGDLRTEAIDAEALRQLLQADEQ